jgi:hypothetical protein
MPIPYLFYISVAFIVICITGRKQAIGGWLLYFYYWIFAVLFISLRDITLNLKVFRPSFDSGSFNHEALILAVFPRLFVYIALAAVGIVLLVKKEWVWVERLRVVLLAGIIIAALSVWLDVRYFPKATYSNGARWIGLCFWLIYFFVSKRVHHVFRTHDWDKFRSQITTDS